MSDLGMVRLPLHVYIILACILACLQTRLDLHCLHPRVISAALHHITYSVYIFTLHATCDLLGVTLTALAFARRPCQCMTPFTVGAVQAKEACCHCVWDYLCTQPPRVERPTGWCGAFDAGTISPQLLHVVQYIYM